MSRWHVQDHTAYMWQNWGLKTSPICSKLLLIPLYQLVDTQSLFPSLPTDKHRRLFSYNEYLVTVMDLTWCTHFFIQLTCRYPHFLCADGEAEVQRD